MTLATTFIYGQPFTTSTQKRTDSSNNIEKYDDRLVKVKNTTGVIVGTVEDITDVNGESVANTTVKNTTGTNVTGILEVNFTIGAELFGRCQDPRSPCSCHTTIRRGSHIVDHTCTNTQRRQPPKGMQCVNIKELLPNTQYGTRNVGCELRCIEDCNPQLHREKDSE